MRLAAVPDVNNFNADLTPMRWLLKGLIAECAAGKRPRSCPIIAILVAGV